MKDVLQIVSDRQKEHSKRVTWYLWIANVAAIASLIGTNLLWYLALTR